MVETSEHSSISSTSSKEGVMDGLEVQVRGEQAERKLSASSGGSSPLINGGESPHIDSHPSHRVTTNGHNNEVHEKGEEREREREREREKRERCMLFCIIAKSRIVGCIM